jgi:hypothetical protein
MRFCGTRELTAVAISLCGDAVCPLCQALQFRWTVVKLQKE